MSVTESMAEAREVFRKKVLEALRFLDEDLKDMKRGRYDETMLNVFNFYGLFSYDDVVMFNRGIKRMLPNYSLHAELTLIQDRLKDERFSRVSDYKMVRRLRNIFYDLEHLIPKHEYNTPQDNKTPLDTSKKKVAISFECENSKDEGFL